MNYVSLPVINYQTLHEPSTLRALDCACRSWGAFVLTATSLEEDHKRALLRELEGFFAQPRSYKRRVERSAANPNGFFDAELTGNVRDEKEIFDYSPAELAADTSCWPAGRDGFRARTKQHFFLAESIALSLVAAICQNLGASMHDVRGHFQPRHTSFLRFNYYPPQNKRSRQDGEPVMGVHPHTDAGILTLLLQDGKPGLEIFRDNQWHRVCGNALVVNIGDIVQVWSNDRYRAALHRVVASSDRARYSAPFFFNPAFDTSYRPLPSTVDSLHPPVYHAINWGEFRRLRAAGDFADYGEEVQISQYRMEA